MIQCLPKRGWEFMQQEWKEEVAKKYLPTGSGEMSVRRRRWRFAASDEVGRDFFFFPFFVTFFFVSKI